MCDYTFLARLSPDARKIEWVRTLKGLSDAPRLQTGRDGRISFLGLTGDRAEAEIDFRVGMQCHAGEPPPPRKS